MYKTQETKMQRHHGKQTIAERFSKNVLSHLQTKPHTSERSQK